MKKIRKVLVGILVVLLLIGATGLIFATRGLEEGKVVRVEAVDIHSLEDGTYQGSYDYRRWENQVKVTVEKGEILDIQQIDGFKQEEVKEQIFQRVLTNQSLEVDTVTGATVSSKAYLKAIEAALKSSPVE